MSEMYKLPETEFSNIKEGASKIAQNKTLQSVGLLVIIVVALLFASGNISVEKMRGYYNSVFKNVESNIQQVLENQKPAQEYVSNISYEQAIIDAVKIASPSVVSIIISKNLPVYEQQFINPFGDIPGFGFPFNFQVPEYVQKGTELKEVGAGSGFIVTNDGLVVTNKHVVFDKNAEYTVLTNEGKKYSAKVVALDPVQDLAIIKIQSSNSFPSIVLGDSNGIQIGQGAIAIGNALGQFSNTVSVGIISGLGRTILASGSQGFSETLENIIQTDAAINQGNSGGPLINLKGEVIGVNTATAAGAQTIGFAIPINIAKKDIGQIVATNKITYPFLGVRYVLVDDEVKKEHNLSVDYGAIVLKGENGEVPVTKDSAADKAGIKEKDVLLEFNQEKITKNDSLTEIISKYNPGDTINLKMLRGDAEMTLQVTLGERPQ